MKQGHIFFVLGTAGAGKDTLIGNIKKSQLGEELHTVISYKSREKRSAEIDGVDAHFVSNEDFSEMIKRGEFLEYEFVHNLAYYGTKKSDIVEKGINEGKIIVKEIEIAGLESILQNYSELRGGITSIFLSLTVEKMRERVAMRGENMSGEELLNREESLKKEVVGAKKYCDYTIDTSNITPEEVFEKAEQIILSKISK